MTRIARLARLLPLVLLMLSPLATARATEASPAAREAWGFDRSDLTPHPGVRFGVLPNGMRYALMRGAAPLDGLSVRLHVDAGAGVEGAREAGFMHLIEHLVFGESANLPPLALPLMLRQAGLRRFADFNAFTSADETVYRLDLSRADGRARQAALTLMREIANHLVFTPRALRIAKRAVVDEIRAGDAVREALVAAQGAFLLPETRGARGGVAGTERSIGRASGAALRRLYDRHYVPGRTTLVIVGDVDPDAVEAKIVAAFALWTPKAGSRAAPRPVPPTAAPFGGGSGRAGLFVDRAAPTTVTIATVARRDGGDAGARRDASFLEHLGSRMLERRLAEGAARADARFAGGTSALYDQAAVARIARIDLSAKHRDWRGALAAGAQTLLRALDDGFSQAEFDAQIAAGRRALATNAAPRSNAALADAIADAVGRRILFTAPADAAATDAYLAGLRLADANAAFRAVWADRTPLIFVSHDEAVADAGVAIVAVWDKAVAAERRDAGAPRTRP